jgi:outer membrane protein, heavy metal efflux system
MVRRSIGSLLLTAALTGGPLGGLFAGGPVRPGGETCMTPPGLLPETREGLFRGSPPLVPPAPIVPDVGASSLLGPTPLPRPVFVPPTSDRLQIPPALPGANAPPIRLPDPANKKAREEAIRNLFPDLPPLLGVPQEAPGPKGSALSLPELQEIALAQNPTIRQAIADVNAARGTAIQAGLYPNPSFGYQADQVGGTGTWGQQGAYLEQLIKTAGKLRLARLSALMDFFNAQLALRRAQIDLFTNVRSGYFAALVARQNLDVAIALAQFTDQVYRVQIAQVRGGQAAPYEPLQVYVLAVQARGVVVQARNRYISAWKQLAAALGNPTMPLTELTGRAEAPVPVYPYDSALGRILERHTDVGTAQNTILRARYDLRLAQVTPIPDIATHFYFQRDNTTHPAFGQVGIQAGFAIPIWNRNQGAILAARGQLARAENDVQRVQNDLSRQLAEAYERYLNARTLAEYYRDRVLPTQVRVYRAVRDRYQQEPDKVDFNYIVTTQQTLATAVTTYLTTLSAQWQAVVDIAALLQTNDLYELDPVHGPSPIPCSQGTPPESLSAPRPVPSGADTSPKRQRGDDTSPKRERGEQPRREQRVPFVPRAAR